MHRLNLTINEKEILSILENDEFTSNEDFKS